MRYANITSIPSSYIVAFFSSLVPASVLPSWGAIPQLDNKKKSSEMNKNSRQTTLSLKKSDKNLEFCKKVVPLHRF